MRQCVTYRRYTETRESQKVQTMAKWFCLTDILPGAWRYVTTDFSVQVTGN